MRPYELAFVLACFIQLAVLSFLPEPRWLAWITAAALAGAFILHARSQNLRVDMVGGYFVGAMLMAATIWPMNLGEWSQVALTVLGTALLAGTALFAVLHVPAPSGRFLVGSVTPDWRIFAPQELAARAPAVELWYPVEAGESRQSFSARMRVVLGRFLRTGETGLPQAPIENAPLVKQPAMFPVILCFSGGAGEGVDTIYLINELVSQGFVVATVHYPIALPGLSQEELERRRAELALPFMDLSSASAFTESLAISNARVRNRAGDAASVLNALAALNAGDPGGRFKGRLNIDGAGVFGFSFGGAVAAEARLRDKRFKAAINIDGWHFCEAAEQGVESPYLMIISSDTRMPTADELQAPSPETRFSALLTKREFDQPIAAMARNGGYLLSVNGAKHANLTDAAFRCFLMRRMPLGPIDPNRAFEIMASYAVAFFQTYLLDNRSPLLDSAARAYAEAHLKAWTFD